MTHLTDYTRIAIQVDKPLKQALINFTEKKRVTLTAVLTRVIEDFLYSNGYEKPLERAGYKKSMLDLGRVNSWKRGDHKSERV